jgi:hypothetical protein
MPLTPSPAARQGCTKARGLAVGAACHRFYVEVGMLSKRTLLGLVRNPLLLASHATAAVYFACTTTLHTQTHVL